MDKIANIAAMIVVLAMITAILASKNTATDVKALGSVFTNAIGAATGH